MKEADRFILIGIIIMIAGVVFSITIGSSIESLGSVFFILGVLFVMIGISHKQAKGDQ